MTHRDPAASLQGELHWELEEDGSTRPDLPLHLPVPHVLILVVQLKKKKSGILYI